MNLESIFEDFEAQLAAEESAAEQVGSLDATNLARVYSSDGGFTDLVAVLLGSDFVAGMALLSREWRLIGLASVERIEFCELVGADMPVLRFFEGSRLDFLERLPLPISITWRFRGSGQMQRGILVDFKGECCFVEVLSSSTPIGVPLARIEVLGIDSVENFDEFDS
jgi:hypothetical protein